MISDGFGSCHPDPYCTAKAPISGVNRAARKAHFTDHRKDRTSFQAAGSDAIFLPKYSFAKDSFARMRSLAAGPGSRKKSGQVTSCPETLSTTRKSVEAPVSR